MQKATACALAIGGASRASLLALLTLLAVGCGGAADTPLTPPPAVVARVNLTAVSNAPLQAGQSVLLSAVAVDANGSPVIGQSISFASSNTSLLTVSPAGLATSVGPVGAASVTASSRGVVSEPLVVTITPGPPASMFATKGESQLGRPAGSVSDSVGVRVVDSFGNGISGTTITWTATGPGTLASQTTTTDANGRTANIITLGSAAGTVIVNASVSASNVVPSVSFTLTSVPFTVVLTKVAGDNQVGVTDLPLADSLVVRVADQSGSAMSGAVVRWTINGSTVTSKSDASGLARLSTLGRTGAFNVNVATDGAQAAVSFSESGLAQVPCDLSAPDASGLHWENEGATNYATFARPLGDVNAVMLFVDFSDAPESQPTSTYASAFVPDAVDFFAEASYGRMSLNVTVVPKWYRMSKASDAYGMTRAAAPSFATQRAYMAEAIALADADVDFSKYSHVYIVASRASRLDYSPGFIAPSGLGITADGKELRHGATLGTDLWGYSPLPNYGAHIFAHETGHTFGMPDLYTFESVTNYYDLFKWAGGWDIMSWTVPGGHFFAWHKFKFGWIQPGELGCMDRGSTEVLLTPDELPGAMKMLAVKLDASHALVMEARGALGHDGFVKYEGVLLYRVDATAPTGGTPSGGPIVVIPAGVATDSTLIRSIGPLYNATFGLQAGQVSAYTDPGSGITITVKSVVNGAYRVVVRRP